MRKITEGTKIISPPCLNCRWWDSGNCEGAEEGKDDDALPCSAYLALGFCIICKARVPGKEEFCEDCSEEKEEDKMEKIIEKNEDYNVDYSGGCDFCKEPFDPTELYYPEKNNKVICFPCMIEQQRQPLFFSVKGKEG